uniref:Potassium channel domain-containing protein n=1 Tax=Romanomermis culicivorax TaxID=13658 RepID=A0A915J9D5_ROMCU
MDTDFEDRDDTTPDTIIPNILQDLSNDNCSLLPVDEDDEIIEAKPKESCMSRTTRYAKRILPHVGLVLLLGIYTVIGAGIFHVIELPNEEKVRSSALQKIKATKDEIVIKFWNVSVEGEYDERMWKEDLNRHLQELETVLYEAFRNEYSGHSKTLGYGHLVPRTTSGRILCIVFGLFGIPLLLITIADIGKFLADFMKYLYRSYIGFKIRLKETRRRLTEFRFKGRMNTSPLNVRKDGQLIVEGKPSEMRLPWLMVMFVLVTYAALGAFLFHLWEGWDYFESFYFCFVTMATVGFGDIVPTQQVYMFFTIAYILIGLALTTMCIDLAGTEYIDKIHKLGERIDVAKGIVGGAVVSGLHAGENLLKHTGYDFIRTAGGRLICKLTFLLLIGISSKNRGDNDVFFDEEFGAMGAQFMTLRRRGVGNVHESILHSPVPPEVEKLLKPHIKIRIEDLKETDAYVCENKTFNRPLDKPKKRRRQQGRSKQDIKRRLGRSMSWPRKVASIDNLLIIAPFLLKESDV